MRALSTTLVRREPIADTDMKGEKKKRAKKKRSELIETMSK